MPKFVFMRSSSRSPSEKLTRASICCKETSGVNLRSTLSISFIGSEIGANEFIHFGLDTLFEGSVSGCLV